MSLYTRIAAGLLFPLHERLKRHDTVATLAGLERSQWLDASELQALQLEALRRLLAAVSGRVPYYRELFAARGLAADDFRELADLALLPVTDKALIRAQGPAWQADGATTVAWQRTSGSSGEPLHFLLGRHRVSFDIAAKWRAMRWWDVDIGDPEVVLWGSAIEGRAQDRLREWRDRLLRSRLVPTHNLTPTRMDEVLDEIRAFRPRMLFGYPSALSRLAFHARAQRRRMDDLGIRVAFCTSEVLRPEWRAAIGETFGCGVANEYGARDAGFLARECPHGGLHLTAEEVIVEVVDVDGNPLPAGEEGDIVVTNLAGPEFPFIRYRTGDRGRLSAAPCPCGRGLPLLAEIGGRANDGLVAADGAWVHGSAFNHLMRDLAGLEAYRIVQDRRDRVRVLLRLGGELPPAQADGLAGAFRDRLGAGIAVEIEAVDEIPPLPNGKFRHIVCEVDGATRGAPA